MLLNSLDVSLTFLSKYSRNTLKKNKYINKINISLSTMLPTPGCTLLSLDNTVLQVSVDKGVSVGVGVGAVVLMFIHKSFEVPQCQSKTPS